MTGRAETRLGFDCARSVQPEGARAKPPARRHIRIDAVPKSRTFSVAKGETTSVAFDRDSVRLQGNSVYHPQEAKLAHRRSTERDLYAGLEGGRG